MSTHRILVTGGSGFVGGHVILQLLDAGHKVRATIRNLDREGAVRAALAAAGADPGDRLSLVAADLERDDGWAAAVKDCDFVQHVASPFPPVQPKDENDLLRPAIEGTVRVLTAARDAGVHRVVLTSSYAAVGYGPSTHDGPRDERDWTDVSGPRAQPYMKSKTLAERTAWDFIEREGDGMELSVVNPVGIFGPALNADLSTSIDLIKALLEGRYPGTPRIYFSIVDVRDVASLQVLAMTHAGAANQRLIALAGEPASLHEIATYLRDGLGRAAAKVPTREMPDWLVRAFALVNPAAREAVPRLGLRSVASNAKARALGWTPRSNAEAVVATGESLIRLGLVKP